MWKHLEHRQLTNNIMAKKKKFILCVDDSQVRETLDFESFSIIDTEVGIIFHVKGGYDVFVQPRMASLYQHLRILIDNKHRYEGLSDKEKQIFDAVFSATVTNLEIPLFMACNDVYLFDIAEKALACLNKAADEALNAPLQEETPIENAEFEQKLQASLVIEEAFKDLKPKEEETDESNL